MLAELADGSLALGEADAERGLLAHGIDGTAVDGRPAAPAGPLSRPFPPLEAAPCTGGTRHTSGLR